MGIEISKPIIRRKKFSAGPNVEAIDLFPRALKELFFIENPSLDPETENTKKLLKKFLISHKDNDVWIYYPWHKKFIHCVSEELYLKLRTARNRNLITDEEQRNYRDAKIGIAGLSVGSAILSALVMTGGPKVIKIADSDTIEISNLNRMKAKLADVGLKKTVVSAREIWELDPFAEISIWRSGLNSNILRKFILKEPALNIFIDEIDKIDLKISFRLLCRAHRIPVLMATDNGDSVILDIERFDLEPKRPIFHGALKNIDPRRLRNLNFERWLQFTAKIIEPRLMTERHQESVLQIRKNIRGAPQLGTAALVAGAATAFAVRRIANKQKMPSGRYVIGLEEKLIHGYASTRQKQRRMSKTHDFIKQLAVNLRDKKFFKSRPT